MGKIVDDSVLDVALNEIRTKCTLMTACAGEPANFAAANVGGANFLADAPMTPADFTISNGDVSGRKVAVAAKAGIIVDNTGTADHVALLDTVNSILLYVTTSTSLGLTSGSALTLSTWDVEIADPSL
ncbi:MAG: hypothetical protein COA93_07200 [Alphaproteobacteria bacterium]|nr:MAG: hypothetical protein COA93_07200 [Alphaproteobacteria bacterium]